MESPELKDRNLPETETVLCEAVHVTNRPPHCNRKAGSVRTSPHEAHSVTGTGKLARPRVLGKVYPHSQVPLRHLQWWLQEKNILVGQPLHPIQHACQIFTDTYIKRRMGCSSGRIHSQRSVVHPGTQITHQLPGIESSSASPEML